MRLQMSAVALSAVALAACGATHEASSRVHFYADPRITVWSPAVEEKARVEGTTLTADYGVDVLSGATQVLTVDAVSSATRFQEERHQAGLTAARKVSRETEVSLSYQRSMEPDHVADAPSLGASQAFLDEQARATVGYQLIVETLTRAGEPSFSAEALGHRLDLGWTQIASRELTLTALATATLFDCTANVGCFSNPYRFVGVSVDGRPLALRERHPASRQTGAAAARLAWAFAEASALHAGLRVASDTWSVTAATLDASLARELLGDKLLLRAEARATAQSQASFYRALYLGTASALPAYRTADSELSSLWNLRLQGAAEWSLGELRLVASVGHMWNRYSDFPSMPARDAWLGGLGLDADF